MQFNQLKRRDFITLLGGAAAWPVLARAQQGERVGRIGVLTPFPADDAEGHARLTAFTQALQQSGWTVGQNVRIDYRGGPGNAATMRKYAAELVALAPDVILAHDSPAMPPLLQATRTVPIVFTVVSDPVAAGFVDDSPARPGGNATGFMNFEFSLSGVGGYFCCKIRSRIPSATQRRDT
jgi:putative tryptophan/tyrosine transport system substrate-binding protein